MSTAFIRDAAERILWTFVYAVASTLAATTVWNVDAVKAAAINALPLVFVTIKTLVASRIGNPNSAAIGGE